MHTDFSFWGGCHLLIGLALVLFLVAPQSAFSCHQKNPQPHGSDTSCDGGGGGGGNGRYRLSRFNGEHT